MITKPIDSETALISLDSRICPACGGRKARAQTLCGGHYHALPREMKNALYNRVGQGYERALLEALNFLEVKMIHLPKAATSN